MASPGADPAASRSLTTGAKRLLAPDGRMAAFLVAALGLVSLATGLLQLEHGFSHFRGVIGGAVPQQYSMMLADFAIATPLIVGGGLIALAVFLRYRYRFAWYLAVAMLPITLTQSLLLSHLHTIVPLLVLTLLTAPVLIANRGYFDLRTPVSVVQVVAFLALGGVLAYGTIGVYLFRRNFSNINTLTDALYYIVVTGTTVGYGDATPQTTQAKLFTLTVLVSGTIAFSVAFGSLLIPAIESTFERMRNSPIHHHEDHVIVLGYSDMTARIIDELDDETEFILVTADSQRATALDDENFDVLAEPPDDVDALEKASIRDADRVIVASDDDAQNALAVLAVRQLDREIPIIAGAAQHDNVEKLGIAGATTVISPNDIAGRLIGKTATGDAPSDEPPEDLLDETGGSSFEFGV